MRTGRLDSDPAASIDLVSIKRGSTGELRAAALTACANSLDMDDAAELVAMICRDDLVAAILEDALEAGAAS